MATKESYRGFVVEADPVRRGARWAPRAVFEIHEHGAVSFQEVRGNPFETYDTRGEADRASLAMGKAILDTRPPHGPPGADQVERE